MRSPARLFVALALAATAVVGGLVPAAAASDGQASVLPVTVRGDVNDFSFSSFDGRYTLGRDASGNSTLESVETFVAEFPDFDQNRGIIRAIPTGANGVNWKTEVISVTDAAGTPVAFDDSETDDGFLMLVLGTDDYVRGTQTYVITYSQRDVVRAFANTALDEFYWDAPGTGFAQSFDRAQMTVVVDDSVAANFEQGQCYSGPQGSTDRCEIAQSQTGSTTQFSSPVLPLGPRENISLALGFSSGTFTTPEIPSTWPLFNAVPIGLTVVMVLVFGGAVVSRRRSTPDAPGRGVVVPQYTAPPGLDIFTAADVIGRVPQAMPALLVSLAVRGYLRLIDVSASSGKNTSFALELLAPPQPVGRSDNPLSAAEHTVLSRLFGAGAAPGAVRQLDAKDTALSKSVDGWKKAAPQQSVAAGLRVKKSVSGARWWVVGALIVAAASVALVVLAAVLYGMNGWVFLALIVGIVGLVAVGIAASPRLALTEKGVEILDYLKGLRDYLKLAEEDRIAMLQSPDGAERVTLDHRQIVKLYEKLLPYAVLWKVEQEWAEVLSRYYDSSHSEPDWYNSTNGFSTGFFIGSLSSFSSPTGSGTPWAASATASATGGSGGGGFSGGGGGGGGGGGR